MYLARPLRDARVFLRLSHCELNMYYKDNTRRLSLLSGLLLGSLLGAAAAWLLGATWRHGARRSVKGVLPQR